MPDELDKPSDEVDPHAGQQITLTDLLFMIAAISAPTAGIMAGYQRSLVGAGVGAVIGVAMGMGTCVGMYLLRERLFRRLDSMSAIRAEVEYCLFAVFQVAWAIATCFVAASLTNWVLAFVLG